MTTAEVSQLDYAAGKTHTSAAVQGPPSRTGCVPLPELRSNSREGGSDEGAQGGVLYPGSGYFWAMLRKSSAMSTNASTMSGSKCVPLPRMMVLQAWSCENAGL